MAPSIDLFTPLKIGRISLKNRIIMAPMTRNRAEKGNVPAQISAAYYGQRSSAGLIVTEATQVCPMGQGYISTPGIHSNDQVEGWRRITETVHQKGGVIFLQLWHVGRISHPDFHGGKLPVAPSAIAPRGVSTYTPEGLKPIPTPRALELSEIPGIVEEYRNGAQNALNAGFDGVEVHGANGYLLDQFLEDSTNQRSDQYGGSIENRARLMLEVMEAVVSVWGSERVGIRLSPGGTFNDMGDSHPQETFGYVVRQLAGMKLGYIHLIEPVVPEGEHSVPDLSAAFFRPIYPGTIIAAGNYSFEKGTQVVQSGSADLIAFGRPFLANPDLVSRFRKKAPLNAPDPDTFYMGGPKGYTDYPLLEDTNLD
ncbi:MAG: alkene reductase [Leptospirales bacterium]